MLGAVDLDRRPRRGELVTRTPSGRDLAGVDVDAACGGIYLHYGRVADAVARAPLHGFAGVHRLSP